MIRLPTKKAITNSVDAPTSDINLGVPLVQPSSKHSPEKAMRRRPRTRIESESTILHRQIRQSKKKTPIPLPLSVSQSSLAASVSHGILLGHRRERESLEEVIKDTILCSKRSKSPTRRCKTSYGTRGCIYTPSIIPSSSGSRASFLSERIGEQVVILEALGKRPVSAGLDTGSSNLGGTTSKGETLGRGPALLKCLDFVENNARKGFKPSCEEDERMLQDAFELIRSSLFSNWLQVGAPKETDALQPVPYVELTRSLDCRTKEQETDILNMRAELLNVRRERDSLQNTIQSNAEELEEARRVRDEAEESEKKHAQYIQRLRRDVMQSFDDLKSMETSRDAANALAKGRSIELAQVERKLAQQEEMRQLQEERLTHLKSRTNVLESQVGELQAENKQLRNKLSEMERLLAASTAREQEVETKRVQLFRRSNAANRTLNI